MTKAIALLALLWTTDPLVPPGGVDVQVIPTRIRVEPQLFGRGQAVAVTASFRQPVGCPLGGTRSFGLRVYDDKDVPTEPTPETVPIATSSATLDPVAGGDGGKVERAFEPFAIPAGAPGRLYVTVWHGCTFKVLRDPFADPPIYEERHTDVRIGGQFFRYGCPGTGPIPTGRCAYRPEE